MSGASSGNGHVTSSAPALVRGAFVISIDTELAWGEADRRGPAHTGRSYEREREVIGRILEVFDRHGISATWAVVGHLFLDGCQKGPDGPHPEVARAGYDWLEGDWFDIDPCSSAGDAPSFYGPDIVDAILACPTPQEIGSHSFSHLIVDDPACSPEVFASDLDAAASVAARRGVELRSFVYPRNGVAHLEELAAHGFRSYRGRRATPAFAGRPSWQRRVLYTADRVHPLRGSAAYPARHECGLWNIPQSYYLFGPIKSRRLVPTSHQRRPVVRLRQAARHRSLFHMWFHPHNVIATPGALATLDHICAAAARLRDAGRLDVLTMGALTTRLDAASSSAAT